MRLIFLALLFSAWQPACASLITYNLEIRADLGSGIVTAGTGQITYDSALVQRQGAFTFVAPGGLGLLSLDIAVLGASLNLGNAVNGPNMPTLYLDPVTLAPGSFELWGAWGNTGSADGPGFQFARSFEFDSSAHSYYAYRSGDGSSTVGAVPRPGDPTGFRGIVVYTAAIPEPSTWILLSTAVLPLLLTARRRLKPPLPV